MQNKKTSKLTRKTHSKYTNTHKSRSNRHTLVRKGIKVLAYNISWESMTGRKPEWELCSNNTDPAHPRHNSICVGNVARVFEENTADFILLQEADSHDHLIKQSPRLSKMDYEYHESSKDKMITFWNKKYKPVKVIRDKFEPGRPWMAILYSNGWCVVNVHFGHYSKTDEINMMNQLIRKIKKELRTRQGQYQNVCKRIIIGGDFNYDIKRLGRDGKMVIDNTEFNYHAKNLLTCCINRMVQNDHVIDTHAPLLDIEIPKVAHLASDHKPVLATLV